MSARLKVEDWEVAAGARRLVGVPALGVRAGELWALRGQSGTGKSVLLRSFIGLLSVGLSVLRGRMALSQAEIALEVSLPSQGERLSFAERVAPLRGRCLTLVPAVGVAGLDPLRTLGAQVGAGRPWWPRIGLEESLLARRPGQVSEGQARRALVAAGLATPARIVLLDEPSEGLDPLTRRQLWAALRVEADQGRGLLVATHDEDPPVDGEVWLEGP